MHAERISSKSNTVSALDVGDLAGGAELSFIDMVLS